MSLGELLVDLRDRGVELWLEGDRLRFRAPRGAMTDELRARVQEHRARLTAWLQAEPRPPAIARSADTPGTEQPLSFAQQRLWIEAQLHPENLAYNLAVRVSLTGELDDEALERALDDLIARHEALRTRFEIRGGEPVAIVDLPAALTWTRLDVAGDADVDEVVEAERHRPFALVGGRLLRASLLRRGARRHDVIVSAHHMIADGWSFETMVGELIALYAGRRAAAAPALAPLPLRYRDYVAWQRALDQGPVGAAARAFWQGRLDGSNPRVELPGPTRDRARPSPAAAHPVTISAETARAIEACAREQRATPLAVVGAAFGILLARLGGQADVVIATPLAGRSRPELEPLVGFFVNLAPLRVPAGGDLSFGGLVERVRDELLAAQEHQDLPPHNADVNAVVVWESVAPCPRDVASLAFEITPIAAAATPFDLVLAVRGAADGLAARLEYAADRFTPAQVASWARGLEHVLARAAAEPAVRLAALSATAPIDAARLRELARGEALPVAPATVPALVLQRAAAAPGAVAIVAAGETVTYGELRERALARARGLVAAGVRPGDRVGLCLERSPDLVIDALATMLIAATYVPIDPRTPASRRARLFASAGVAAVIGDDPPPADDGAVELPAGPTGTDAAYLVFTSGSTGEPKGVVVEHAALANLVAWHLTTYEVGTDDRATLVAGPGFDASVWEIWPYLVAGASLHIPPEAMRLDPAALVDWLADEAITISFLPTPLAEATLALPWPGTCRLRALLTGGDRLRHGAPANLPFRLHNHYGPTESCVVATAGVVAVAGAQLPSIGRPIANLRTYVIDAAGHVAPDGALGELCVGGAGLARGYHGRPELTAERFVALEAVGERVYRTGDIVRAHADGTIEFHGRRDEQVKIRGHRIELGEIEACLLAHPRVREAAVCVDVERGPEPRLVAYVVASDRDALAHELRAHLLRELPEAMVPAHVVWLDALPLSTNGKVDRRALAAQADVAQSPRQASPPRGPIEIGVARLFEEILGVGGVGRDDDFFHLGGHSLLVIRLVARVRERLGAELSLRAVFEARTVEALARRIAARDACSGPALVRRSRAAGPLPASCGQEQLWLLCQQPENDAAYHVLGGLRLAGSIDEQALRDAFDDLSRRHEVLRTRLVVTQEGLVQEVGARGFVLEVEERALPPAVRDGAARARLRAASRRPFDLGAGPLARAYLQRYADDDALLVVDLHHAIADEWSIALLLEELDAAYAARRKGLAWSAEPPAIQFGDFAAWQREHLVGERLGAGLAHWKAYLEGAPQTLALEGDRPRAGSRRRAGTVSRHLDAELQGSVREAASRFGTTEHVIHLAAYAAWLGRRTAQQQVLVGTPVSARGAAGTEDLVGFLVNLIVLRATPRSAEGEVPFAQLVEELRLGMLAGLEHADVPFDQVAAAVTSTAAPGTRPLVQAVFATGQPRPAHRRIDDLDAREVRAELAIAKFDLTLQRIGDELVLEYDADVFDEARVEDWLDDYERGLRRALAEPGTGASARASLGLPRPGPAAPAVVPVETLDPRADPEAVRRALAAAWCETLGLRDAAGEDSFFALGGTSLGVMRLFGQVRALVGANIPIVRFYARPTLEGLTELVLGEPARRPDDADESPLVVLHPATDRPNVFCIHPGGGHLVNYMELAQELHERGFAVMGLQARGLSSDAAPREHIEDMAAAYAGAVDRAQPDGPLTLVGYCIGGLVALEMARALRRRGRTLRLVALLDTFPPMLMPGRDTVSPRDVVRSATIELSIQLPLDALAELPPERWGDRVWEALAEQRPVAAEQLGRAQLERLFRVQLVTMNAVTRYRPARFDGEATLFSARGLQAPRDEREAQEIYARQAAQVASWREHYPELEHVDVPGYHISMMHRPEVADLADLLVERIERGTCR